MFNIDKQQLKSLANKALIYALIIYVFVILGRAVWQNWQLKREIDAIKNQIAQLQDQNKNLENLILYYQSDSFKEMEARQKLGLKKPGETAVAVPTKKYENYQAETAREKENIAPKNQGEATPNWQAWWGYFFR